MLRLSNTDLKYSHAIDSVKNKGNTAQAFCENAKIWQNGDMNKQMKLVGLDDELARKEKQPKRKFELAQQVQKLKKELEGI